MIEANQDELLCPALPPGRARRGAGGERAAAGPGRGCRYAKKFRRRVRWATGAGDGRKGTRRGGRGGTGLRLCPLRGFCALLRSRRRSAGWEQFALSRSPRALPTPALPQRGGNTAEGVCVPPPQV